MPEHAIATMRMRAAEALRLSQELNEPNAARMFREMAAGLEAEAQRLEAKETGERPAIPLHEE